MKHIIKKFKKYDCNWLRLAVAISASLIFIGMLSIYINDLLKPEFNLWLVVRTFIAIILLLGSLYWTNYERKKFSSISIPVERDLGLQERTFEALIMPLSVNQLRADIITPSNSAKTLKITKIIQNGTEKEFSFEDTSEPSPFKRLEELLLDNSGPPYAKEIFSNWQMPLTSIIRNIKHDKGGSGLKQLWLIGSKNIHYDNTEKTIDGSAGQLKHLIKILLFFFKNKFDIYVYDIKNNTHIKIDPAGAKSIDELLTDDIVKQIGLDFDDFRQVYESFNKIIHKIVKISKEEGDEIEEHRIAIDITGGQKPISVAGAIATLIFKTKIVYVNTNRLPDMKEIDAKMETEPELS